MQFQADYTHFAMRRLKLCRMERQRFKVSPQIPLEIFLLLGSNHGASPLSEIYEQIPATEKAIRLCICTISFHPALSSNRQRVMTNARRKLH